MTTASLLRWRVRILAPLATLAMWMAACDGPAAITDPTLPDGAELLASVSDGAHDGNPHFFFLPPIARHDGAFTGVFDGSLDPVVDICRLDGTECASPVGHFSATPRRGRGESERLRAGDEYYLGNWRTNRSRLDPESFYRICVSVGPKALGHADVDGQSFFGGRKDGGRREGRELALPVRFRIEHGALDPGAFVDGECVSALRPGAIGGTKCLITAAPEQDSEDHPYGWVGLSPRLSGNRGEREHDDGHARSRRCKHANEHGTGIADWPISLSGTDDQGNSVSLTTATDTRGKYSFADLRPGTYTVCEGTKEGFVQVFPTTGATCPGGTFGYHFVLSSGQVLRRMDFGNKPGALPPPPPGAPGSLEGAVLIAGTSIGLSNWLITLLDGNGTQLAQTNSDASGMYAFADLQPGTYQVCEDLPGFMTVDMQFKPLVGDPGTAPCANGTTGYLVTIPAAGGVTRNLDFHNAISG